MIVKKTPSSLWTLPFPDLVSLLREALVKGLEEAPGRNCTIFFRADDIAVPGAMFAAMIRTFQTYHIPLCPALVPTWLSTTRWNKIMELCGSTPALWAWHQHGWRHVNHETQGKNQEFGPGYPEEKKRNDLRRGMSRIRELAGDSFIPVFTPPWNRMDETTMDILTELGFRGISRSENARPAAPAHLPDLQVNVDLHTRKEPLAHECLHNLLNELTRAVATGRCGVMLHHQRMNRTAVNGLETLLKLVAGTPGLKPVHFGDLLEQ